MKTTLFSKCTSLRWGLMASALVLLCGLSWAQLATGASLTTDQTDYAPGTTATITGTGFGPNDIVTVQVVHADGTPSTGAEHDPWTVTPIGGSFTTTWHVCEDDCVGSTLKVTAVGSPSSLSATAFFTDAPQQNCP